MRNTSREQKEPRVLSCENLDRNAYNPRKTISSSDFSNKISLETMNKLKYSFNMKSRENYTPTSNSNNNIKAVNTHESNYHYNINKLYIIDENSKSNNMLISARNNYYNYNSYNTLSNKQMIRYNSTGKNKNEAESNSNEKNQDPGPYLRLISPKHAVCNEDPQNKIKRPLSSVKLFEKNAIIKNKVETDANIEQKDIFIGDIEQYRLEQEIGKGSFASVKKAIHKITGEKFAIKIYDKSRLVDSARRGTVKREIQILKKLNNKYTIKLYEVIENSKYVIKKYKK